MRAVLRWLRWFVSWRGLLIWSAPAAVIACEFPEVTYVSPDGSGSSSESSKESGAREGASSGSTDGTVALGDADATVEGAPADHAVADTTTDEAASSIEGGADMGVAQEGGPDADAGLNGVSDASAINCDCGAGQMYPTLLAGMCGLAGLLCSQPEGFVGAPPCGTMGQYIYCGTQGSGLSLICQETDAEMKLQQCH